MTESFENLANILRDWANDRSCRGIEQVQEAGRRKQNPFLFLENPKKYSSSLSRQSSETKPNTKLVLKLAYFRVRNHYLT